MGGKRQFKSKKPPSLEGGGPPKAVEGFVSMESPCHYVTLFHYHFVCYADISPDRGIFI